MTKLPKKIFNKPVIFLSIATFIVMLGSALYFSYRLGYLDFLLSFFGKPKPGSCLILQEKYCDKGTPIYKDSELIFYAFKLPEGTYIFSPFNGDLSHTPTFNLKVDDRVETYQGSSVFSSDLLEGEKKYLQRPALGFAFVYHALPEENRVVSRDISYGEVIGQVGVETIDIYGDYNLLVSISEYDSETSLYSTSGDLLDDYFVLQEQ